MSYLIHTPIKTQPSSKQEIPCIDTQSNNFGNKNRSNQSKKTRNHNSVTLLISRKQVIQEFSSKYLNNQKDKKDTMKLKKPAHHIPHAKQLPRQDKQLHLIKRGIEHTLLVFQPLFYQKIIENKNYQNRNKPNGRNKKKKKIVLAKYWDNQAPLFSLGRNARILKKSLRKEKSKTQVILPKTVKKAVSAVSGSHRLLNPNYWNKIIEYWLSLNQNERQDSIETLLQPTIIDGSDLRKKLHGQYGVLAARDIPPYSVIVPYSGLYCIGSDILKEKACYGLNVDRYVVDCSIDNLQVNLCGYGHGNITLCINANTTYSMEDPVLNDNACFALIVYQGWPYIFVISISNIKRNSELLIDYGRYYWKGL